MDKDGDTLRPWGRAVAVGLFAAFGLALTTATAAMAPLGGPWLHGTADGLDHAMMRADDRRWTAWSTLKGSFFLLPGACALPIALSGAITAQGERREKQRK